MSTCCRFILHIDFIRWPAITRAKAVSCLWMWVCYGSGVDRLAYEAPIVPRFSCVRRYSTKHFSAIDLGAKAAAPTSLSLSLYLNRRMVSLTKPAENQQTKTWTKEIIKSGTYDDKRLWKQEACLDVLTRQYELLETVVVGLIQRTDRLFLRLIESYRPHSPSCIRENLLPVLFGWEHRCIESITRSNSVRTQNTITSQYPPPPFVFNPGPHHAFLTIQTRHPLHPQAPGMVRENVHKNISLYCISRCLPSNRTRYRPTPHSPAILVLSATHLMYRNKNMRGSMFHMSIR